MGTTTFVWDPVFYCVSHELDGTGAVEAIYTNEPQQYGGVISQHRDGTTSTLHADALGSTRFLTDESGTVTDTYLYDAWGNTVAETGSTTMPFKWGGRYGYYTDESTRQVYVRARMYQPDLARWSSSDPVFPVDGPNAFVSHGIGINHVDPSGLLLLAVDGTGSRLFREGLHWIYACWYVPHRLGRAVRCGWKLVPSPKGPAPKTTSNRYQSHVYKF